MLYLALVLAVQSVGRGALSGEVESVDIEKLRPAVFTIVAIEEPENSLSPYYLGRIFGILNDLIKYSDAQALVTTHAPSLLKRVDPLAIRYFRLNRSRTTEIKTIELPQKDDDAHKFVSEAVQAYPAIYFSRLVILGEGDSEQIVLERLFRAKGLATDESAIVIAPLGGRHVNHFWRLLSALENPYLTLLDLDVGRYGGGWGRISYVNKQLAEHEPVKVLPSHYSIPDWNADALISVDGRHKPRIYGAQSP